jgi:AI2M/AI1M-like, HNH endonuclease/Type II intron maturase
LGFAGPKSEAEEIKSTLRKYLQEELKLELSEEKTLITHARSEAARFLGYEVFIYQSDTKQTRTLGRFKRRSINGGIGLHIPKDILEGKCNKYLRQGKAIHRTELTNHSDYDIVMVYQQEFRGIANYYQMACNMITLGKLKWIMRQSLSKTLAAKHKLSMTKIAKRYQAEVVANHRKYQVLQVIVPRPEKKPLIATWGGVPLVWNIQATLEDQPKKLWAGRSELERRLLAAACELCGDTENIEIHHVRAMKDLHEYPGRPKAEWVKRMIALKRKTLALCRTCHEDVTYGRPLRRQRIKLEEVKARQKAKTMILESRMQ